MSDPLASLLGEAIKVEVANSVRGLHEPTLDQRIAARLRAAGVTLAPQPEAPRAGGSSPDPATCEHDALIDGDDNCPDCGAPVVYRAAPQPEAGSLRDALDQVHLAQIVHEAMGYTDDYHGQPNCGIVAERIAAALRAALSPDPAAGTNLLDEDQGESAIDRRAREREG